MQIGTKLRLLRKKYGHTLLDVSKGTELSVSFLSDVERGRTNPSLETLEKVASFYQMPPNELLSNIEVEPADERNSYPEGFLEFLKEVNDIDEEIVNLLLQVERRAVQSAQTKEDWLRYYYSLKTLLGR